MARISSLRLSLEGLQANPAAMCGGHDRDIITQPPNFYILIVSRETFGGDSLDKLEAISTFMANVGLPGALCVCLVGIIGYSIFRLFNLVAPPEEHEEKEE